MMHPEPFALRTYANSTPTEREGQTDISRHLTECPACREYVALIDDWNRELENTRIQEPNARALQFGERLYRAAFGTAAPARANVIELIPMPSVPSAAPLRVAADSKEMSRAPAGLEHAATLYAANPEMVLRVMRDRRSGRQSLHLLAPDPQKAAHVYIQTLDPPRDFLTDADGTAQVSEPLEHPENLKWRVRLPDAAFSLTPLETGQQQATASREFELATDDDNRIRIQLESHTEGIRLRLALLRIGGRDDLSRARLIVSQESVSRALETHGHEPCVISGLSVADPIDIRVFAD